MKRSWLGAGLLALLLLGGILSSRWLIHTHQDIAGDVEQAVEYALREDWEQATRLTRQARDSWEQCRKPSATLVDHAPLERIDTLFDQLEVYAEARETVSFAASCVQLSKEIEDLSDAHRVNWQNLL